MDGQIPRCSHVYAALWGGLHLLLLLTMRLFEINGQHWYGEKEPKFGSVTSMLAVYPKGKAF